MLHMYYYINNNIIIWQMQHMIKKKLNWDGDSNMVLFHENESGKLTQEKMKNYGQNMI